MARITRVAKAQQRFKMVPVIDEATGEQKVTPVMVKGRDGVLVQKTTKTGKPVTMKVTVTDKSKPLPPRKCESCREPIEIGTPYQHVTPKSGPYGGTTRYRHQSCPTWQPWDLSNSLSARVAQIVYDAEQEEITADSETDDVQQILNDAATAVEELAQEKEDAANNIIDGFQHSTSMSDELEDVASQLRDWASELEGTTLTDKPDEPSDGEPGEEPDDDTEEGDEPSQEWRDWEQTRDEWDAYQTELESWVETVQSEVSEALGGSPF